MSTLLTVYFHLEDFDHYGIRNILLDPEKHITKENILFYYKNFIGMKEEYVFTFENIIPENFNLDLLGKCGNPKKIYPVYDCLIDKIKIENYKTFLTNVIATEKSRIALLSTSTDSTNLFEKPEWLKEIETFYETFKNEKTEKKNIRYQGIVIAPVHNFTKESKGYKFLTKESDIELWSFLLGTYAYPDFMIVRKYNVLNWNFVNESSEKMLNKLFYWYASAFGCKTHYSFVPCNIEQFDNLINCFKPIGFTFVERDCKNALMEHVFDFDDETFADSTKPDIFPVDDPLKLALAQIEELMLSNLTMIDCSKLVLFENQNILNRYVYQLLSDLNIGFTPENEYLINECTRWFRDKWGVKKERLELARESDEIFKLITDFHSFNEKALDVWLMYREAISFGESLTRNRKIEIISEFVRIFMAQCIKTKDDRRIRSMVVYEYLTECLLKILPKKQFEKLLVANNLYKMVINCGIRSIFTVQTRHFIGINVPGHIEERVKTALDELLEHVD